VTRWKRPLLFGALAVLAPALAGCEAGYNAPTLEYHQAAFGAYASKNGVSISNAFVLGPSPSGPEVAGGRAGAFLAITSENGDKLVSASAPGTASSVQILGAPVRVPAVGSANLTGPVPRVVLTGLANPLQGGELVKLNLTFAEAGTIAMTVPVQPKAYEYATFSPPATPSPAAATKKKRAKANPLISATAPGSASPGSTASPTATPTP
jgi:copper(I)-binding protein